MSISDSASVREYLKLSTRDLHGRLDVAAGVMRLETYPGYGDFLAAHAAALIPLEAALEKGGSNVSCPIGRFAAAAPPWPRTWPIWACRAKPWPLRCSGLMPAFWGRPMCWRDRGWTRAPCWDG